MFTARQVRKENIILWTIADKVSIIFHIMFIVDKYCARRSFQSAGNHERSRRFSRFTLTKQNCDFVFPYIHRYIVDGHNPIISFVFEKKEKR